MDADKEVLRFVNGWAARSYLAKDGWWAAHVVRRFADAARFGFVLAQIHFHHEGHFVRYNRKALDLYLSYEPGVSIGAGVFFRDKERYLPIAELPTVDEVPVRSDVTVDLSDRDSMIAAIDHLADEFMRAAPKLILESTP